MMDKWRARERSARDIFAAQVLNIAQFLHENEDTHVFHYVSILLLLLLSHSLTLLHTVHSSFVCHVLMLKYHQKQIATNPSG